MENCHTSALNHPPAISVHASIILSTPTSCFLLLPPSIYFAPPENSQPSPQFFPFTFSKTQPHHVLPLSYPHRYTSVSRSMVYSITYRRPSHVDSASRSLNGDEKVMSIDESVRSGSTTLPGGIPDALAFDRIIAGGTCPVSLQQPPAFLSNSWKPAGIHFYPHTILFHLQPLWHCQLSPLCIPKSKRLPSDAELARPFRCKRPSLSPYR